MSTTKRSFTGAGIAATLALLAALTAFHPNWIELAFGIDPDSGSGLMEWALVLAPALVAIACGTVAWRKWSSARA
jgi:apolipoprotein N-acyltransferase